MALAEQLVTVGAVLVGAGGSYLTSRLTDRDRFERDLRVRWDDRRLDSYTAYIVAIKRTFRCVWRVLYAHFNGQEAESRDSLIDKMREAEDERSQAFEQLLLLGTAEAVRAAHKLNERVWRLEKLVELLQGGERIDEAEWHESADRWLVALNDFHYQARIGLGVPGEFARSDVGAAIPYEDQDQ